MQAAYHRHVLAWSRVPDEQQGWEASGVESAAAVAETRGQPLRVLTVGDIDVQPALAAISAAGLSIAGGDDPAALSVVLCDDYLTPELAGSWHPDARTLVRRGDTAPAPRLHPPVTTSSSPIPRRSSTGCCPATPRPGCSRRCSTPRPPSTPPASGP